MRGAHVDGAGASEGSHLISIRSGDHHDNTCHAARALTIDGHGQPTEDIERVRERIGVREEIQQAGAAERRGQQGQLCAGCESLACGSG